MIRKIIAFTCIYALTHVNAHGQIPQAMNKADSAFYDGDLKSAIEEYKKIYNSAPLAHAAAYNVAAAYSLNNQPDSAFTYLFKSLLRDTTVRACTDPYFIPLWSDGRWQKFEDEAIRVVEIRKKQKLYDLDLARKYWHMNALDQEYYYELDILERKLGINSEPALALWRLKEAINKKNAEEFDSIFAVKGWPKISEMGFYASEAAFLIVQHSTTERQEKYIVEVEKLCKEDEALWSDYALMYDRICIARDRPQRYGSQCRQDEETGAYSFYPIEDEKNVNARRKEMGLEPIEEYARYFGIEYHPPK